MKFKVVSGFCLGGRGDVYPGDVVELSEKEAAPQLYLQRIQPVAEEKEAKTKADGDAPKGDAPKATNQDPKPTTR